MDRRDFLKTSSTFLAATAFSGVPALSSEPLAAGRVNIPMNRGWRYAPRKMEGAERAEFDDSAFERVVIPHTNVLLPWHSFDDKIAIHDGIEDGSACQPCKTWCLIQSKSGFDIFQEDAFEKGGFLQGRCDLLRV